MAKLIANGRFEIARVVVSFDLDSRTSLTVFAFMSDGWVLKKVNQSGWKTFERVPGIKGRGPWFLDGRMPPTDERRVKYDARVQAMVVTAKCMVANFRERLPTTHSVEYFQKV